MKSSHLFAGNLMTYQKALQRRMATALSSKHTLEANV
jgi:hypothetical protein